MALTVVAVGSVAWFGLTVFEFMGMFELVTESPAVGTAAEVAFAVFLLAGLGFFVVSDPRSIRTLLGVALFGIAGLVVLAPETTIAVWEFDVSFIHSQLAMWLGMILLFSRHSDIGSSLAE